MSGVRRRVVVSHPVHDLGTPSPPGDGRSSSPKRGPQGVGPGKALALLAAARLISAAFNIIHDCDETFNYLEPLHYLLYGYGMQTWEYSSQFALRPYVYLLLHALVGAPAAAIAGSGAGKVAVFYAIKVALATASTLTEWWLYRAVRRRYRHEVANAFLTLLCLSTGMFVSSTGFLPSTFTMYALTAAAAGVLEGRPYSVIVAAVVGVVWGWCVAGAAFLPYAFFVLAATRFFRAVGTGVLCLLGTVLPLALLDRFYYGRWTASLWNFVRYNVANGGDSALYGVEGPEFYLRNGFNNFTLAMPLALLLPLLGVLAGFKLRLGGGGEGKAAAAEQGSTLRLLLSLSPLYVWLGLITALPHKEERFLFVAYPLICLAAASSLVVLSDWAGWLLALLLPPPSARALARLGVRATLVLVGLLALSRSAAQVLNYGAPLAIYRHLPELPAGAALQYVCAGAEWHRFPSAFFLPGPSYRLQFIKSGFTGLLPRNFDPSQGGTAAAPQQLNVKNQEEPDNYWPSPKRCDYVVTLQEGSSHYIDNLGGLRWETVASQPFVDVAKSQAVARAFYIPGWSARKNHYVQYVLLRQRQ